MTDRPTVFDFMQGWRLGHRLRYLGDYLIEVEDDAETYSERLDHVKAYLRWLMEAE